MRTNFFEQNFKLNLLIFFLTFGYLSNNQAQNQNISLTVIPSEGEHEYSFSVNGSGVELDDLIYYRFSDGYHLSTVLTGENPEGIVTRKFKYEGSYEVIAYVAKKGGTLDRAGNNGDVQINSNCNCELPNVVMSSEGANIHMSTSWNAFFTEGVGAIEGLDEDISEPTSTTPSNIPWFFLNLTLQESGVQLNGKLLEFYFPSEVYDVAGVILNDEWIPFSNWTNSYQSNNTLSPLITYHNNGEYDFVRFHLNEGIQDQANFYLVLQGEPMSDFDEYTFTGALFDKRDRRRPIDKYSLKITPTQQPHDPNEIFSPTYGPCDDDEITYKVDFQNLGEGEAVDIDIHVDLDEEYINAYSLAEVTTSHSNFLSSNYTIEDDRIVFSFQNINLPGTNQVNPAPSYNETKGWVKFKLSLHDCLIDDDPNGFGSITTNGKIIFYGVPPYPGAPIFEQHTPLNELLQKACHLPCPNLGRNSEIDNTINASRIGYSGLIEKDPFTVEIYPTIVNDYITIESSLLEPDTLFELNFIDVGGKVWESKNVLPNEKMLYQEQLDISHLPNGIYFLQIRYGSQIQNKKIIKN